MKTICIHYEISNEFWNPHRKLNLNHFRVSFNISPSVDTKLSTFATSIMIYSLHSVCLQKPILKFSHNYWICTDQVPLISFLSHPLITAFTRHASRHGDHLVESLTLLSTMESQSSLLLLQESIGLLISTLHWHVDGHWYGCFIVLITLTLVDSTQIWMWIWPLFTFNHMKIL